MSKSKKSFWRGFIVGFILIFGFILYGVFTEKLFPVPT